MDLQLEDINESILIPLIIRANETKRQKARVRDRKALDIVESLDIDTKKLDRTVPHEYVIARTVLFDRAVKEAIGREPQALCVNLRCGLDDRYVRVDNGWIQWFNLDSPEVIEMRKKAFHETKREKMRECDILDPNWTDCVPKDLPVIIIAEDLLLHDSREHLKAFLEQITAAFRKGVLIADLARRKNTPKEQQENADPSAVKKAWGFVNSGKDLALLDESNLMSFVKETTFSEQMKKNGLKSRICGILSGSLQNRVSVFEWKQPETRPEAEPGSTEESTNE